METEIQDQQHTQLVTSQNLIPSSSHLIKILLFILSLVVLMGTSVLVGIKICRNQIANSELSTNPDKLIDNQIITPSTYDNSPISTTFPKSITTPIIIKNPSTGWSIYQNNQANLYFEYPPEVKVTKQQPNDKNTLLSLNIEGGGNQELTGDNLWDKYLSISLNIKENTDTRTPYMIVAEEVCIATNRAGGGSTDIPACISKTGNQFHTFTQGNITGFKGDVTPGEASTTIIVFKRSNKLYELWLWGAEGTGQGSGAWEVTKSILNTFKFPADTSQR